MSKKKRITRKGVRTKAINVYTPQSLANKIISEVRNNTYSEDANIYNYDEKTIRITVMREWEEHRKKSFLSDKARQLQFEETWEVLRKSRLITSARDHGINNLMSNLKNIGMLKEFQDVIGEPLNRANLYALDNTSWVYWSRDGEAWRISFRDNITGNSIYMPTISPLSTYEKQELQRMYGVR